MTLAGILLPVGLSALGMGPVLKLTAFDFRAMLLHGCTLVVLGGRVLVAVLSHHLIRLVDHVVGLVVHVHLAVTLPRVLRLVAVAKPVMKVIAELLENVHVVPDRAGSLVLGKRAVAM